jgi:hypothetical protein
MRALVAVLLVAAVAFTATAIATRDAGDGSDARPAVPTATATPTPTPTRTPTARRPPRLEPGRCPADLAGCAAVRGRVLYVERVDPDGDGDLHVVVLAGRVTGPGVTAIDVAKDLRPRRDPRAGDLVTAAGPVQPGSYGQSQIHALEFRVARR